MTAVYGDTLSVLRHLVSVLSIQSLQFPTMTPLNDVYAEAAQLLASMASKLDDTWYPSSMSTNVYDTAWASMVSKEVNGSREWLFPKAFEFVLLSQHADGHWDDDEPRANAILSTMAATLACFKHQSYPDLLSRISSPEEIDERTSKSIAWLTDEFFNWDGQHEVDSVALEILVPALLNQLAKYDVSITSPYLAKLTQLSDIRLYKATMALNAGKQITLFHSLEALIGKIDFEKLRGYKVRGSMLGSPSSTAAYLMNVQTWDVEAEMYLRYVFDNCEGNGDGSFPSAAPIDIFEVSWTLSTFLECGIPIDTLGKDHVIRLASHLFQTLEASGNVVGFSWGMLPDADDTAKTLYALSFLPEFRSDVSALASRFCVPGCFTTYEKESTCSVSANCNVLKALVALGSPESFSAQILTAASFICDTWMSGKPRDKWNTAWEYCAMLSVQSLVPLLHRSYDFLPFGIKSVKIPIVLGHILSQLLRNQAPNGSFGNGYDEVTAYATLALTALADPQTNLHLVEENISKAIETASGFLAARLGQWEPQRIWVEKVTYSSELLAKAYCVAGLHQALKFQSNAHHRSSKAHVQFNNLSVLFQSTDLFSRTDGADTMLRLAMQESLPYVTELERTRFDVFPRPAEVNEKYLRVIPFAWTACNHLSGCPLSPSILLDMMEISMLNYQADEFVELQIPLCSNHQISRVQKRLDQYLVESSKNTSKGEASCISVLAEIDDVTTQDLVKGILQTFARYIDRVLHRPHVQDAPPASRILVRQELIGYLQAQISSIGAKDKLRANMSFFDWIHKFGARDTSCPFSFAYYLCLVNHSSLTSSKQIQPITFKADYLLRDLCGSLSRLCRMYNDYGSIHRDREEGNLNSIDFFLQGQYQTTDHKVPVMQSEAKVALWSMANYERGQMNRTFDILRDLLGPRLHRDMQLFLNVTDLFGQIYIVQDIGTRTKVT